MNFAKPLRTPFLTEHLWWLLLSYKLGKATLYCKSSSGLSNSIFVKTYSKLCISDGSNEPGGRSFASRSTESGNAEKRGNLKSAAESRPVSGFNICNSKKEYRTSFYDKFKEIKQTYTILALQNGGSASFEGGSAERGLHVQNRSQGCLFFSALAYRISKISKVSMEKSVVPFPMSILWSGSSTTYIYETVEDSGSSFEEVDGATNISRRYFDYGSLNRGTNIGSRHSKILFPRFGVCNKHEKVSFAAL